MTMSDFAPTTARRVLTLDGRWDWIPDPEARLAPDRLPACAVRIDVPGAWESQIDDPWGVVHAWYRRTIDVPEDWTAERSVVRFDGALDVAEVWLDGQPLGVASGGYLPSEVDATGLVAPGRHELVVRVTNPFNDFDRYPAFDRRVLRQTQQRLAADPPLLERSYGKQTWYSSTSGLLRSVRLVGRSARHIGRLRIAPDLGASLVRVAWQLGGVGEPERGLRLELCVADPAGAVVAAATVAVDATAGLAELRLPDAEPWGIGRPSLYRLEAELVAPVGPLDLVTDRFGMRDIRTADGRIVLNGEPVYLLGALDQDFHATTLVTPPSRAYLVEQMRRARELGINCVRCHVTVPDERYLEAADETGMLVWCELPNWGRFTEAAGERGLRLLEGFVDAFGNHPSIVAWTIINEDWGTRVRVRRAHREWLRAAHDRLRAHDPTRLVVDNSACGRLGEENFHVRTDLADFHVYHAMPEQSAAWRDRIADFAGRPAWLWSPFGDAESTGTEPLILSEFGNWGLPRPSAVRRDGRDPWWFATGRRVARPAGIDDRFRRFGLDRVFADVDELATATQWHQFEALQYEIGELRRHGSIGGYVITELTDVFWEANGLLDIERAPKAYHDRFTEINAPDVVFADLPRRDLWGGASLEGTAFLSSWGSPRAGGGRIEVRLEVGGREVASQALRVPRWPRASSTDPLPFRLTVPDVAAPADAILHVAAIDDDGVRRAGTSYRLAILPSDARRTSRPRRVAIDDDPQACAAIAARLAAVGHEIVPPVHAETLVAPAMTAGVAARLAAGGSALVLAREEAALPDAWVGPGRVVERAPSSRQVRRPGNTWYGDWINPFGWLVPGSLPGLPERRLLDFSFSEVMPDHVLAGHAPNTAWTDVLAGVFVGWVHAPGAYLWQPTLAAGSLLLTTFRVAPEDGPVATVLLDAIVQRAAEGGDHDGAR